MKRASLAGDFMHAPPSRLVALAAVLLAAASCTSGSSKSEAPAARSAAARQALATDLTLVADTQSPAVSGAVNLRLTAPVHGDVSLISQTLSLSFDKSKLTATGAPIIPEGWTATYFNGASALPSAPVNAAQWALVDKIVASGSVESDGSAAGQQVIVGNAGGSIPPPPTATTFSGGSAGDGWDVIFSPDRKRVFNVHHHDSPPTVMCRNAADGSSCGAGYPFALFHTSNRSTGWIDPDTGRFWHETYSGTTAGWECVDVSGVMGATYSPPAYCPTRFVSAGFSATNYDVHIDLVNVGKELYGLDTNSGRLTCLDASAGAPCAGQPYAGFGGVGAGNVSLIAIEGKVYVHGSSKVMCFDPATKAACTNGWPASGRPTTKVRPVMAVPDATGKLNVCVQGDCWSLDGSATSLPASFATFMTSNPVDSGCCGTYYSKTAYGNTKLFFPMSSNRLQCWDSAANGGAGGQCTTTGTGAVPYPLIVNQIYTAVIDPLNANCLWTNSHDGVIRTWDVPSGSAGCKAPPPPPPVATYYPQAVIPRLACDGSTRIGAWRSFKVVNPEPSEYTSATVTIRDSNGADIPGWVNVPVPASQVIDLSGLTTAMTGPNPAFAITFVGLVNDITQGAVTGGPQAQFKVIGDSPQMCLAAQMRACASGSGVFPSGGATATSVTGEGSAAVAANPAVAFTPASISISDAAALAANCGATLNGTLAEGDGTPMAGLDVGLLDTLGQTVPAANGAPIRTSSNASGVFTFPPLMPGTYTVRMTGTATRALKSITVTAGGAGTVNVSGISGISAPITASPAAVSTVNGLYVDPSTLVGPDGGAIAYDPSAFQGSSQFIFTASTLTPAQGQAVQYSAKVPLQDVRQVVANAIDVSIDPARQHLTGAPTAPEGWAVQYFSNGVALPAAPTTPAGWASVDRIVADGGVRFDGVVNGHQMYVGASVATAPPPTAASFSGGSAGDGWDVIFSPDRTKVFNVHHHDSPPTVMCRKAADGSSCGAGWPFSLFHTSNRSTGWIDPDTGYFWHETYSGSTAGWECVDVSGTLGATYSPPAYCPTRFVSAGFTATNYDVHIDLVNVGKELYGLDTSSGRLTCLDASAGAPCAGQPYAGFGGVGAGSVSITAIAGKLYVHGSARVKCFDPATKAACSNGFPVEGVTTSKVRPVMAVPDATGKLNVCVQGDCWALDGSASTLPAGFSSFMASNPVDSGCCGTHYSKTAYSTTKLFFPMSANRLHCWDSAANAGLGGACATSGSGAMPYPITVNQIYTAIADPADENCLWTNSHDGVIRTWNVNKGTTGCAPPPGLVKFKPSITLPRLACDPARRVGDWSVFKLTAPSTAQYTSASLTVKDSANAEIPGWTNRALPASQQLDLTGLTMALTGPSPTFEVTFQGLNFTGNPTADFTVVSGSPELCFTAIDTCPTAPGALPTVAPPATTATAKGSLTLADGSIVELSPIDRTVQFQAPGVAACGGTISGALASVEGRAVPNVPVALLDGAGNPLLSAQTGANSAYAFPPLVAGTYRVKVSDVRGWVVDSITVVSGGSGTVAASGGSAVSNAVLVVPASARVVNAQVHVGDSDGDGLPDDKESGPNFADLDTDGDGVADHLDLDSDDDGMLDALENRGLATLVDSDEDGTPDLRDFDSDGDGIADVIESGATNDVALTKLSGPVGANGIVDAIETAPESGIIAFTIANTDGDAKRDALDDDSDADGLLDAVEGVSDVDGDGVLAFRDLDSDNDGLPDALERGTGPQPRDTDNDGIPDYVDTDSDGDGIADSTEAGFAAAQLNPDGTLKGPFGANGLAIALETSPGSGVIAYVPRDQDGDGTPDWLSGDSDGDGLPDALEKGLTQLPVDSDGDGKPDYLDLDSDGDAIADSVEANGAVPVDTDGDLTPDHLDLDSDDDSLPDLIETAADADGDGKGNWRDLDSDGDFVTDRVEGAGDPDADGIPSFLDLDSDGDGIDDVVETDGDGTLVDTDLDLVADLLDLDSDGDGIPDAVETSADRDADGKGNWRDLDSDGDGIEDAVERGPDGAHPRNSDSDTYADYLDTDSDDDVLLDAWERGPVAGAQRDTDGDGTPDYRDTDSDGDGIGDIVETNGDATLVDTDGDGTLDVFDLDTDADGISDLRETAADFDGDGIGNWRDLDADGDGLTDEWEKGSASIPRDSDSDGAPDYLDLDSDGDTLTDAVEKGIVANVLTDTDMDGTPNLLDLDSDNDCRLDVNEPAFSTDPSMPNENPSDNCGGAGACQLSTGMCLVACTADADCGGASSGKICDPTSRLCTDGCRGTGGNSCPASHFCSSSTSSAGVCEIDSDGDGMTDRAELALGLDPNAKDSDGDGIDDSIETNGGKVVDTDKDGTPDALDADSDGDGIPDSVEKAVDTDGDGTPDFRDADSDGDGFTDADERAVDTDGDGTPDYRDADSDGDGLSDAHEKRIGTSRVNPDTDGDGLADAAEAGTGEVAIDTDADGVNDALDGDSDGDGLADNLEASGGVTVDTDGDGKANHVDTDSDGDGIPDAVEAHGGVTADTDGDGKSDHLDTDADADGVSDAVEAGPVALQPVDTDGDGTPDFRDLDSDNDCVADASEEGAARTDASLPAADADLACPASAPKCDTKSGRCVLPANALPDDAATLQGAGGRCGCSGGEGLLSALGLLVVAGFRRRRAKKQA